MQDADHYFNLLSRAQLMAEELQDLVAPTPPLKSILQGMKSSRAAGTGMDFREHNDFNPEIHEQSDIDHKASARTPGRVLVRRNDDESPVRWALWRGGGDSMNFTSAGDRQTKQEAADLLLLTTARLLLHRTQAAQVTLLNGSGHSYSSRQQLANLALELEQTQSEDSRLGALDFNGATLKPRSRAVLFGDCVNSAVDSKDLAAALKAEPNADRHVDIWARHYIAPIVRDIEQLHAMEIKGRLVHVFDPLEWGFPFGKGGVDGRIKFEFGQASVTLPRAGGVRGDYLGRIRAVQTALHQALESYEWDYSIYVTDDRPEAGMMPVLGLPDEAGAKSFRPEGPGASMDLPLSDAGKKAPGALKNLLLRRAGP